VTGRNDLEEVVVAGVAGQANQAKLTLRNVTDAPGIAAKVFGALAREAVVVDVIVQDSGSEGRLTISFTVEETDRLTAHRVLDRLKASEPGFSNLEIHEDKGLAKVSIVGAGMQNNPGVASRMFEILAQAGVNILLITTSEIKVSCLVAGGDLKKAVAGLHAGFGLDRLD
jgi:aspartate kinase